MEPRELINEIERQPTLRDDDRERFRGYAVMGLPFRSGHILGLRRWPASSIGPEYTSVWHRDPDGRWTFYTDVEPRISCNRYFGAEIDDVRVCDVDIDWTGPRDFRVRTGGGEIDWRLTLTATPVSRVVSTICSHMPDALYDRKTTLRAMGAAGGPLLRIGKLNLTGSSPNRQEFQAHPVRIWMIPESTAVVHGAELGEVGATPEPVRLGDFWFPQRGLFAVAESFAEPFDPEKHRDRVLKSESGIAPGRQQAGETARAASSTPG